MTIFAALHFIFAFHNIPKYVDISQSKKLQKCCTYIWILEKSFTKELCKSRQINDFFKHGVTRYN